MFLLAPSISLQQASIFFAGKTRYLGTFDTSCMAASAYAIALGFLRQGRSTKGLSEDELDNMFAAARGTANDAVAALSWSDETADDGALPVDTANETGSIIPRAQLSTRELFRRYFLGRNAVDGSYARLHYCPCCTKATSIPLRCYSESERSSLTMLVVEEGGRITQISYDGTLAGKSNVAIFHPLTQRLPAVKSDRRLVGDRRNRGAVQGRIRTAKDHYRAHCRVEELPIYLNDTHIDWNKVVQDDAEHSHDHEEEDDEENNSCTSSRDGGEDEGAAKAGHQQPTRNPRITKVLPPRRASGEKANMARR